MKANKLISIVFAVAIFFGIAITAEATLYPNPLSLSDFQNLTNGGSYGPPPAIGFPDGPTSVQNGENVSLTYGPSPGQTGVNALLFVLSYDPSLSLSGLISFSLAGEGSVDFGSSDFYTTADAGFPDNIAGIANGEVGGVKFPDAVHAGAVYYTFSGGATGDPFGTVSITSPIFPLRVDIFSLEGSFSSNPGIDGTIIGNTPNSHSLAVVPEPATMLLLGSGLLGLAGVGRKKFFKKK